ncbi:MAG: DNA helicase RecG [Deltaproteobacteria bacterium HGW-Deltaproteobacteria-12]|jgi:ATP-dependent DNA helicase RecG|nr:MAG: DNA helicase RecG [Deltaproteobacteria bacterium HGW-Deltaproteobacteria-12]
MEEFKKILQKIEQPLHFASQNNFKNFAHIKDLGKTLMNLSAMLKGSLPAVLPDKSLKLADELLKVFAEYDSLEDKLKKLKIEQALSLMAALKEAVNSASITVMLHDEQSVQRITDLKDTLAKLALPIQYLKGVGPKMAQRFGAKKINNVEDLLYFLPRTYEDRREIKKINRLENGKAQTIMGKVILAEYKHYGRRRILEISISDNTANLTAKWFKGQTSYLMGVFKQGTRVILTGNVTPGYTGKAMIHPDYEILEDHDEEDLLNFKRIVPVYSETEGLHQKYMRKVINQALTNYSRYVISPIPPEICRKRNLIDLPDALRSVHFPGMHENPENYNLQRSSAHHRLIYDEFFFFQLGMAIRKSGRILERGISFNTQTSLLEKFFAGLPFSLTAAQRRVTDEILLDMAKVTAMHRLLQGDVGSGKTIVSMAAMVIACANDYQAALMAPTEILAKQHYRSIKEWSDNLGLKVVLLTGSRNTVERKEVLDQINSGSANIIIGTHALIQENVDFHQLGLVVIDEQHRFGVMQRATLRNKGIDADVLVMTATPIPRTLAMTVYGDLDVSVIDEMPPGKKPVATSVLGENKRSKVYSIIAGELSRGHQAFIVYPLVEQSENLDLKDATNMAAHLQKDVFPDYKVGLIHGKMTDKEKDAVMQAFQENEIHILVATTVIEVGIDIPRASLIVIEHAERFGLSQLHQLRGRVGRRDIPSSCILLADYARSDIARKRLKVMEKTTDGFALAEEDLALRGPGDFLGTRQSGLPDFRVASIIRDARILNDAKEDAFDLAARDPFLEKPEHLILRETLLWKWQGKLDLARTA